MLKEEWQLNFRLKSLGILLGRWVILTTPVFVTAAEPYTWFFSEEGIAAYTSKSYLLLGAVSLFSGGEIIHSVQYLWSAPKFRYI